MSHSLTPTGRGLVLMTAFLGWLCAGFHLAITSLAMRPAAIDLLSRSGTLDRSTYEAALRAEARKQLPAEEQEVLDADKARVQRWWAWYQCAFLFGAATGGLFFGRVGDQLGRVRGMGLSILTYSLGAAVTALVQEPWQLVCLWFLTCTGVGGMWPNGVALVSEAWASLSRPLAAGLIGTSANIGIYGLNTLGRFLKITPDNWQWVLIPAAVPVVLGLFVLLAVPESPLWLARRERKMESTVQPREFQPQLLTLVLLGIVLATVPLIGGWGSANWMVPWADEVGYAANPSGPSLGARVGQARSLTGIVGSLLGGWIAGRVGRRRSYCLTSLAALFCAQYTFWLLTPTDSTFLLWVSALGFFSGVYFGWLPLCLPELFPTAVRSTGAGVSFNFGRILTGVTIFLTGILIYLFAGDYARIGRVTSLVYLVGALVIWAAPDTTQRRLEDSEIKS